VRILVVWLPAIPSDFGPPTGSLRIRDPRVIEFWDQKGWLSRRATGSKTGFDFVVYFPPGTVWQDPFPAGGSAGSPIHASLGVIEAALLHE
jgi:hypothetical protein